MFIYVPKSRKGKGIIFAILALVCLVMTGSETFDYFSAGNELPKSTSEISYTDIEKGNIYLTDAIVLDAYASEEKDDKVYYYCLAIFYTDNGSIFNVANLKVSPKDDIYSTVEDYIYNEDASLGDCKVSGYFNCSTLNLDSQLNIYYAEYVKELVDEGIIYQEEVVDYTLTYMYGPEMSAEDVLKAEKKDSVEMIIFFGIGAVLLGIVAFVLLKPKKEVASTTIEYVQPEPAADSMESVAVESETSPENAHDPKNYTPEM